MRYRRRNPTGAAARRSLPLAKSLRPERQVDAVGVSGTGEVGLGVVQEGLGRSVTGAGSLGDLLYGQRGAGSVEAGEPLGQVDDLDSGHPSEVGDGGIQVERSRVPES